MPLKRKTYRCSFQTELKILCAYCILHLLTIFLDLALPVVLLYGPVLYRLFRSLTEASVMSRNEYHLHQLPFYVLTVLGQLDLDLYVTLYLPAMPLSLVAYSGHILVHRRNIARGSSIAESQLFKLLVIISLAVSVPLLMFVSQRFVNWDLGFSVRNLIYYILVLCIVMMGTYLFFRQRRSSLGIVESTLPVEITTDSSSDSVNLTKVLKEQKLYLDPLLSLEKFASEVGLPKHKCTKLIQVEHGKSFYQLIAEYRIEHARQLFKQDVLNELTIEGIAESCGFNSKASFNRYFRDLSGCTPSEYRKNMREISDVSS